MGITYHLNRPVQAEDVAEVFKSSGIRRPVHDLQRIQSMIEKANLIMTAWDEDNNLVGIARSLTDYSYCCYLSCLAVKKEYQKQGIGKELIKRTQEHLGESVTLLLLSAPEAMEYYPTLGFQQANNAWLIPRVK